MGVVREDDAVAAGERRTVGGLDAHLEHDTADGERAYAVGRQELAQSRGNAA
jgi:hypothetical protein